MVKVHLEKNRLSVGSWSFPIAPSPSSRSSSTTREAIPIPIPPAAIPEVEKQPETSSFIASTLPNAPITTSPPTKTKTSLMLQLSSTIARETEKLDRYLKENGFSEPGFDVDAPSNFPKLSEEMKKTREEIMRATKELGDLVTGPTETVRWMAWDHNNSLSLKAIYHYKIAKSFPINSTATFSQISTKIGLDETNTRRFLRHAMTNRIFTEVSPGVVGHTALSRVLAEDTAMDDWVGLCVDELLPAATSTIAAIELHPSASEPTQTGFCVANNTTDKEPMFVTFGKDPARAKRMGGAMTSLIGGEGYELSYLLQITTGPLSTLAQEPR